MPWLPHEEEIGRGDWVEGDAAKRRRMQQEELGPVAGKAARAKHRRQEGYSPQFYEAIEDA